jgi:hypothetical protein
MIFTTWFVIAFGLVLMVIYIIWLTSTNRNKNINLADAGSVFFQGSSIIGGSKLMYTTFLALLNSPNGEISADKIYIFYGGMCVIYISALTLYKKVSN